MGWVISYGIFHITNWDSPAAVFSAVTGAAESGGIFTFIQQSGVPTGYAIFFYPVGLAYGALCNGISHYVKNLTPGTDQIFTTLHLGELAIIILAIGSGLALWLILFNPLGDRQPRPPG
jgi:hypothetical protein